MRPKETEKERPLLAAPASESDCLRSRILSAGDLCCRTWVVFRFSAEARGAVVVFQLPAAGAAAFFAAADRVYAPSARAAAAAAVAFVVGAADSAAARASG